MTDEELSREINDSLANLLQAARRFFTCASIAYGEELPADAAAFAALAQAGDAVPGVTMMPFEPRMLVQLGYTYKGTWQPFFSWQPPAPTAKEIN